jgi:hypothetical protein
MDLSLAKDGEWLWLSRLCTRYRNVVKKYKDVEHDLYSNDFTNDDLEIRF